MPAVWMVDGLRDVLQTYVQNTSLLVWPYKNDRQPTADDTLSLYFEADFSGYDGPVPLTSWGSPYLSNGRCFINSAPVAWLHNGGPTDNMIFGIVCVDGLGNLVYAERDPRAPVLVDPAHPNYGYRPILTDAVEFPG